jgi:hypothetical protein
VRSADGRASRGTRCGGSSPADGQGSSGRVTCPGQISLALVARIDFLVLALVAVVAMRATPTSLAATAC